jgi:Ca2+-binding RTX toxin-like protein
MLSAAPVAAAAVDESIVYATPAPLVLSGARGDYLEVPHTSAFELSEGSFVITFVADDVDDRQALFSKDADGYGAGGHLTAYVDDRRVHVRLQDTEKSVWLKTDDVLRVGQEYHLAVTFGSDGFWVYLDGRLEGWRTGFHQGIAANTNSLAIGANTSSRTAENPGVRWDFFDGRINTFAVYDGQLTQNEVEDLAGVVPPQPLTRPTVIDGVLTGTDGNDMLSGNRPINGAYGDDRLVGSMLDDMLDGGHGEDVVKGGAGNDMLVSRSDGREPKLAQAYVPGEDDPYGELDPNTLTIYPDQPIASDDLLIGGTGADTFRFEILVNAKRNIILKHVNDDRTIDWMGVTGENNLVHDHWVDRIGDEVILDFNRAQGDMIEVVGHTVDVYKIEHRDHDGDGVLDSSILFVQSNQGAAGAHNKDKLGTITVFGDLVTYADLMVHAHEVYGIVETIDELEEAYGPKSGSPVESDGSSRWLSAAVNLKDGTLPSGAVFAVPGDVPLSGEEGDYVQVRHTSSMALAQGTIAFAFVANDVGRWQALFSKDAEGHGNGGHLSAFVNEGRVEVRLQSTDKSVWIKSQSVLVAGQEYHVAITFGSGGLKLFLDGQLVASNIQFQQGIATNTSDLAIGANTWGRSASNPRWTSDFFCGVISRFTIYSSQLTPAAITRLFGAGDGELAAAVDAALVSADEEEPLEGIDVDALLEDG